MKHKHHSPGTERDSFLSRLMFVPAVLLDDRAGWDGMGWSVAQDHDAHSFSPLAGEVSAFSRKMCCSRLALSREISAACSLQVLLAAVLIRQSYAQIAGMVWGHSTLSHFQSPYMTDQQGVRQLRVTPRSDLMRAKTTSCRLSMSSISTPAFWESASMCKWAASTTATSSLDLCRKLQNQVSARDLRPRKW